MILNSQCLHPYLCAKTQVHTVSYLCTHLYLCVHAHTPASMSSVQNFPPSRSFKKGTADGIGYASWLSSTPTSESHNHWIHHVVHLWWGRGSLSCLLGRRGMRPPPERRAGMGGSCQVMEPREQMAAAQHPPSPRSLAARETLGSKDSVATSLPSLGHPALCPPTRLWSNTDQAAILPQLQNFRQDG